MADMKLFIELMARSTGLKRELSDSESRFRRFGSVARHEMDRIRQVSGSLQGKLAGLGVTIGALQQMRLSAQLDKGLTQIKQTAGETGDVVKGLRREFFEMSRQTGRDVDGMKTGFDSLIQSGQSWKAALESTRGINIANAVTRSDEKVLARGLTVGAETFNIDLEKPGQALVLLDKMSVAGRLGSAELEDLSGIFARIGANAKSANLSFDKTLAFVEALSKVEKEPERLATLSDSTLRVFTNLRYMSEAQKGTGIQFFDKKGGARDPIAVLEDIKKRWDALTTDKSRALFIQKAFGKADLDTIKGVKTLLNSSSLANIRNFSEKIGSSAGTLQRDLDEAINNSVDQVGRLKAVLREAADGFAQPINKAVADFIKLGLDKKSEGGKELTGKQLIGGTAAIVGGSYVLSRVGKSALGKIAGRLLSSGASTAIGVAEGKALQAAAGVTPVFVTNWPATMGGSRVVDAIASGAIGNGGIAAAKNKWAGKALTVMAPWAVNFGLPVAVTMAPFVGKAISDKARENGWGSRTIHRDSTEYEVMGIGSRRSQPRNDIRIDLQIDAQGRVFARSNDMNTSADIGRRTGDFFRALTDTEAM